MSLNTLPHPQTLDYLLTTVLAIIKIYIHTTVAWELKCTVQGLTQVHILLPGQYHAGHGTTRLTLQVS